jgi:hypothetical protein
MAYDAIVAATPEGRAHASAAKALDYLISPAVQAADGSFSQDPLHTALALRALATATVLLDSDGDGVPDNIERLVGTDPFVPDAKQLSRSNGAGFATPPAYRVFQGAPVVLQLPAADAGTCCSLTLGALPDGLAATTASGKVRIAGTPTHAGTFSFELQYQTSDGQLRKVLASIEVAATLFRIAPDPYPLAALSADPNFQRVLTGWHVLAEDMNADGALDVLLYFNGADEFFRPPNCDACPAYAGPTWGQLAGLRSSSGSLISLQSDVRLAGDLRGMHVYDYNGDGKPDLLLVLHPVQTTSSDPADQSAVPFHNLVLFRNDSTPGGALQFVEVTPTVGLWRTTDGEVAVLDANGDAAPDLVIAGPAAPPRLLIYNPTSGIYEDRSAGAGLVALGHPVAIDFDGDGRLDLAGLDASLGLRFLRNNGNGTFTALSGDVPLTALADRAFTRLRVADITGDGRDDLVLLETATAGSGAGSSYAGSRVTLLENRGVNPATGQPIFADITPAVLATASGDPQEVDYGGEVADYDNDGRLDILVAAREGDGSLIATTIYRQNADGSFVRMAQETGLPRGVASFDSPVSVDLDADGALDLLLPNSSGTQYQLLNNGTPHHSITVVLRARAGTAAVGARVEVVAGDRTQARSVTAEHAHGTRLHFGIGTAESAHVRVRWPQGSVQDLDVSVVDRIVTITQP